MTTLHTNIGQTYFPLHAQEIRLLKLAAGGRDEEIKCELTHASLPNKPDFIALSYAWGSSKLVRSITLNGQVHAVTASAHDGLQRLRQTFGKATVWVDALCINQADDGERNHQVALMSAIFTCASKVIVYLGEVRNSSPSMNTSRRETSPLPIVFPGPTESKSLASFSRYCQSLEVPKSSRTNEAMHVFCLIRSIAEAQNLADTAVLVLRLKKAADSKYHRYLFEALRQLIRCKWWDRMWTLQEVVLPQNITILYGPCVATWDMFVRAANVYSSEGNSLEFLSVPLEYTKVLDLYTQTVLDIEAMRKRWAEREQSTLLPLLRQFSGRKASDARDKVYALLGLVRSHLPIEPDYTLTVAAVFQETKSLDVLNGDIGRKLRQDLPSWVPDWTAEYNDLERRRAETVYLYRTFLQSSIFLMRSGNSGHDTREYLMKSWMERGLGRPPAKWLADRCTKAVGNSDWTCFTQTQTGEDVCQYPEWRCLEAVSEYLSRRCGLQVSKDNTISLPGLRIGRIHSLGQVVLSNLDLTPAIQSWGLLAAKHSWGSNTWISFITTMCADVVWVKSVEGSVCRRAKVNDMFALVSWFVNGPNAPFGSLKVKAMPYLSSIRNALLQLECEVGDSEGSGEILDVEHSVRLATSRRKFFITNTQEFGLGPPQTSSGDEIYALLGARTPFVLCRDGYGLRIVGDCFVQGAMSGAATVLWSNECFAGKGLRPEMKKAIREWENARYKLDLLHVGRLELSKAFRALELWNPERFQTFSDCLMLRRRQMEAFNDTQDETQDEQRTPPRPVVTSGKEDWMIDDDELVNQAVLPVQEDDEVVLSPAIDWKQQTERKKQRFAAKVEKIEQLEKVAMNVKDTTRMEVMRLEFSFLSQRELIYIL